MLSGLITAFILGLIGGALPGPILAATFTEALQSGLLKSFRIVLIGVITETVISLICLITFTSFSFPEAIFRAVSFIGAGILIWMAISIWKINKIDTKQRVHFSNLKIVAMILANGGLWIFVLTVAIPRAILLGQEIRFGALIFLLFEEIGWLLSTASIVLIFSHFRTWLSKPNIVRIIFKIFSLIFIYFAISSVYQSFMFFLRK